MPPVSTPTPAQQAGLDRGRATALVVGLVDDAAVLPPSPTPVDAAVRAHRAHRASGHGLVVGPLLAPVSRLGEVLDALDADPSSDPLDLVLVADTGLVAAAEARAILLDDDRVELLGLEVSLPADGPLGESARLVLDRLDFALPAAIEVPRGPGWRDAVAAIALDGAERVTFRTEATTAAQRPTGTELAEMLVAAVRQGVAFKLTADLRHAVRRAATTDVAEEEAEAHGFVNVLAATAAALDGREVSHVAAVLAERDPLPLLAILADCDPRAVRRRFASFGSCSISDPVADLRRLGMLDEEEI